MVGKPCGKICFGVGPGKGAHEGEELGHRPFALRARDVVHRIECTSTFKPKATVVGIVSAIWPTIAVRRLPVTKPPPKWV